MTDKTKEALKMALEALEQWDDPFYKRGRAITAIREALAEHPAPPPECQTEAEKTAFAFGWFKALETVREQPAIKQDLTTEQNQCKFPLCQSEDYQQALAEQIKRELYTGEPAQPVAFPTVRFENVAEGIEVGYDTLGGVDIRLGGEFVYVHINYDYRYTDNATRKALADQIVGLLTSPPASKPLTDDRLEEMWEADTTSADDCKSLYYFKVVARAIEAAHGIKTIEAKLKEKNA